MSHMSPLLLVVPVLPIQSALAKPLLICVKRDLKVVVAPELNTPRIRLCIIVAVALE